MFVFASAIAIAAGVFVASAVARGGGRACGRADGGRAGGDLWRDGGAVLFAVKQAADGGIIHEGAVVDGQRDMQADGADRETARGTYIYTDNDTYIYTHL